VSGFTAVGLPNEPDFVTAAIHESVTSVDAMLSVNAAPAITTQPHGTSATVPYSTSFPSSITASGGTGLLSYQWQLSTDNGVTFTNLSDGSGIVGSSTPTLTVSGFTAAGSPEYRAIVTDANHVSATSTAATLTIDALLSNN